MPLPLSSESLVTNLQESHPSVMICVLPWKSLFARVDFSSIGGAGSLGRCCKKCVHSTNRKEGIRPEVGYHGRSEAPQYVLPSMLAHRISNVICAVPFRATNCYLAISATCPPHWRMAVKFCLNLGWVILIQLISRVRSHRNHTSGARTVPFTLASSGW